MKKEVLVALILISLIVLVNPELTGDWHKFFQRSRTTKYAWLTPTQTQPIGPSGPVAPVPYQQPTAPTAPQPPAAPTPILPTAPTLPPTKQPTAPTCIPGIESPLALNCNDGKDNDCDGLVDCNDPTYCGLAPNCPESNCADGIDNDFDGKADCLDSGCFGPPSCLTEHYNGFYFSYVSTNNAYNPQYNQSIQLCSDGLDNDKDGLVDCQKDPDCFNTCEEGPTGFLRTTLSGATCLDRLDNDLDGSTDLMDPSCKFFSIESNGAGCYDWLDNDQNGLIDCADPFCLTSPICSEGQFGSIRGSCFDWVDNDNNGVRDCNDLNCMNAGVCGPTETGHCIDYLDNDNDGAVDCLDSDCGNDPVCSACLDSDGGFSATQLGKVTLGGRALYLGHDECIYSTYGTTPTLLHEKTCPVGTLYGIPMARLINCTAIGFTKCQNGRCV